MKENFVRIKNMSKEQLCKLKAWDFCYGFPGAKTFGTFEKRPPGARFSKDPITYRARKAIFNDLYLKKKAVYRD